MEDLVEFGEYVKLTKTEFHSFIKRCKDLKLPEYAPKVMLEKLDDFKGETGRKYKSDYRALRNWVFPWWSKDGFRQPITEDDKIPLVIED